MSRTWVRIDVSEWPILGVEQRGSTRNLWLEEPDTGHRWLHKDTVIPSNGIEQGEDWSEVVSTQVGIALGVPCARTRLCTRDNRRGSISGSILLAGLALNEGTVVLERANAPGYVPHREGRPGVDSRRPGVRRPGHSLANVRGALDEVETPPGFDGPSGLAGFDVFAGYMVLDALIANRDRHEQNWAVLTPPLTSTSERLAPSYDHASSLGFNLTDDRRDRLQMHGEVSAWAHKGTASRFEHEGSPPTLVEHAVEALGLCSSDGAHWWQQRLESLDLTPVQDVLEEREVPGMSAPAARFAHDLLDLNLRRLRDAI